MASNGPPVSRAVVMDASFIVALAAKEAAKFHTAQAQLALYVNDGCFFFGPGVLIAESLFVLCRKLQDGILTEADHALSVASLQSYLKAVLPPPNGDGALVLRAEQIRGSFGCSHSADSIYIALALELAQTFDVEIITFDRGLEKLATKQGTSILARVLEPDSLPST